jgi:allantoicase
MQAYEGYFENGQFFPVVQTAHIKGRRRAFVTILDEPASAPNAKDDKAFWMEFDRMAKASAHENHVFDNEVFCRRPSGREPINFNEE